MTEIDLKDYMQDARGCLVPRANIDERDLMRDDLVKELSAKLLDAQTALNQCKEQAIADVRAFVQLQAEKYGTKPSKKGNITLTSFDGSLRVVVAINDLLSFDERLFAAKALIDECLQDYSQGANSNLIAIVQRAFDVDKDGKISTGKVLSLRSLKIDDEKWQRAMQALSDSLHVQTSKEYIRVYQRNDETGEYDLTVGKGL